MSDKKTTKERIEAVIASVLDIEGSSVEGVLVYEILAIVEGERKQWALETVDKYFGVHIPCDVTKERQRIKEAVEGMTVYTMNKGIGEGVKFILKEDVLKSIDA